MITAHRIKKALQGSPFKPFTILVDSGLQVQVMHPDCMLFASKTCVILEPDETVRFLDYDHISGLSWENGRSKSRRRRSRGR